MRIGDTVRDLCGMKGQVLEIKPGVTCMVRVQWAEHVTWIKARYLVGVIDHKRIKRPD